MENLKTVEYDNKPTLHSLTEWFLHKQTMSQKKIQKLIYYTQAWSLALNDEDFIPGLYFEAWAHGPVHPPLYRDLKKFGWKDIEIKSEDLDWSAKEISKNFNPNQIDLLESVWETYGEYSANELEGFTHSELPWQEKRIGLGSFDRCQERISPETMKNYYRSIYNG